MSNQKGFTILEAVIAMFVVTVGVLAVSVMQQKAIQANQSAFSRTSSTIVATSFLEALKGMSFNSSVLDATANTTDELIVENATHTFDANSFPLLDTMYSISGTEIVDQDNRLYTVRWAVIDNNATASDVPSKTIRMFVDWTSLMGAHQLIMNTVKYNNEATL